MTLLDRVGRYADATAILAGRRFHPWEGGEGLVSGQWVVAHRELARAALRAGRAAEAADLVRLAMDYPANLGEGKHLLTPENELQLLLGRCLAASGSAAEAWRWWLQAAEPQGDPDAPPATGPTGRPWPCATWAMRRPPTPAWRRSGGGPSTGPCAGSHPLLRHLAADPAALRGRPHGAGAAWSRYLEGLALLGQGRSRAAWSRFAEVLAARPEHLEAALRLADIEVGLTAARHARRPGRHLAPPGVHQPPPVSGPSTELGRQLPDAASSGPRSSSR